MIRLSKERVSQSEFESTSKEYEEMCESTI
jgi:hypothetical protein